MNHSINSLVSVNVFSMSPFLSKHVNHVYQCSFFRFFGSVYEGAPSHNLCFSKSSFNRFLSRPIGIEQLMQYASIVAERYTFTSLSTSYQSQFIDCVFRDCISPARGGAIYIDSASVNPVIMRCGFDHCCSTVNIHSAGAISIYASNYVSFSNLCFLNCSCASDPPTYQVSPHGGGVKRLWVNFTTTLNAGNNEYKSNWGPMSGGSELLLSCDNNISNLYSISQYGGGMVFATSNGNNDIVYRSQLKDSLGLGFISFYSISTSKLLTSCNFINNSSHSNYWIYYLSGSFTVSFKECVFVYNKNCKISESGPQPLFSKCFISSDLSIGNRVGSFDPECNFDAQIGDAFSLFTVKTELCWERGFIQLGYQGTLRPQISIKSYYMVLFSPFFMFA